MKLKTMMVGILAFALLISFPVQTEAAEFQIDLVREPIEHVVLSAEYFKDYVETASDGRIEVSIHDTFAVSQGGRELMELMEMGEFDINISAQEEYLSMYVPEMEAINFPFLFSNQMVAEELFRGPFFDRIQEMLLDNSNIHLLSVGKNSIRQSYFQEPLTTPSDIQESGLNMRTMEAPMHMEIWEALGANAISLPGGERYEALDTGMIDGMEGGVRSAYDAGVLEVIDYIVMTNHMFSAFYTHANAQWFQSLPDDIKEIISEGANYASWFQRGLAAESTNEVLRMTAEGGELEHMEVIYLSDEEFNEWREATTEVAREFLEETVGSEFLDYTIEEVEKAEERLNERWRKPAHFGN